MTTNRKFNGVVYTPAWIVNLILEKTLIKHAHNTKICDPSCGDGAFLVRVVERICDGIPAKHCRKALENITGFDIDPLAVKQCKKRLDEALQNKGKRLKIKWDVHCMDSTNRGSLIAYGGYFDYVVGNPPYVRIQHLGKARRKRIQKDWALANKGSTDLYIAFFEIGLFLLKKGGQMGLITPNTYAKTSAGKSLRQLILNRHGLVCLIDFGARQVFDNVTTYSLITVLQKNSKRKTFALYRGDDEKIAGKGQIPVANLSPEENWILESGKTLAKINHIRNRGPALRDIADIHVGIQTLADNVFILERTGKDGSLVVALDENGNKVQLELSVTRPILKASVIKNGCDPKNRIIIFPYDSNCKLIRETVMKDKFPNTYRHLLKNKKRLLGRDKGSFDPVRWYAFGREFGLTTTFGDKLITSGMNKKPNFQKCPSPEYTFYSGYCVKPKDSVDSTELLKALNSSDMEFYIKHTSRDYQHGWKSYAKSFISTFGVPSHISTPHKTIFRF